MSGIGSETVDMLFEVSPIYPASHDDISLCGKLGVQSLNDSVRFSAGDCEHLAHFVYSNE